MRLLVLAPNPPSPLTGGGSIRMFHMIRFLGRRFDVDLIAPALEGAEDAERLCKPFCRDILMVPPVSTSSMLRRIFRVGPYQIDPAIRSAVRSRLAANRYDAVQVEKPAMLPYLPAGLSVPMILDVWAYGLAGPLRAVLHQNGLLTRARNLLQAARFGLFDALCWPKTYCVLVVSEIDRNRCRRARPGRRSLVVANGVDCEAVQPRRPHGAIQQDEPPVIMFTGDMSFAPNVDAALLLATHLFPEVRRRHPRAELHLVGRNPVPQLRELSEPGVTVSGAVKDMVTSLHQATVYAAPHFTGAGTRTKVLEAMAAGLPIVTTSVGIEGIEAVHDREVLIADNLPGLSGALSQLIEDPVRRTSLGTAARQLAEQRYDWPRCLEPLESLYAELAESGGAPC